jgi:hypothetical protein
MSDPSSPAAAAAPLVRLREAEARLLARRARAPAMADAVAEALREAVGGTVPKAFAAGGARLAATVERHGKSFGAAAEPAYHNRHHQAEATLVMGWLAGAARQAGHCDPRQAALCVLAMAGHDLLHAGEVNASAGELERRSANAALALLGDLPAADLEEIRRLILATDPAAPAPIDVAGRLTREADLFGSLTPTLGWSLSAAMARECADAGLQEGEDYATFRGRLALLRAQPEPTEAAIALGLHAGCEAQIAALPAAARGAATPEQAAALLDSLPPAEAAARYRDALRAVGLPELPA